MIFIEFPSIANASSIERCIPIEMTVKYKPFNFNRDTTLMLNQAILKNQHSSTSLSTRSEIKVEMSLANVHNQPSLDFLNEDLIVPFKPAAAFKIRARVKHIKKFAPAIQLD